jgi:hypothetical protein
MGLVLRLVETRADGGTRSIDVLELSRPGNLRDIADLGLTLPEAKQILARVQQAVVAPPVSTAQKIGGAWQSEIGARGRVSGVRRGGSYWAAGGPMSAGEPAVRRRRLLCARR